MASSARAATHYGWYSEQRAQEASRTYLYLTPGGSEVRVTEVTRRSDYAPNDPGAKSVGEVATYVGTAAVARADTPLSLIAPLAQTPALAKAPVPVPLAEAPAPALAETPAPARAETPVPAPLAEAPAPLAEAPAPLAEAPAPLAETSAPLAETVNPRIEPPRRTLHESALLDPPTPHSGDEAILRELGYCDSPPAESRDGSGNDDGVCDGFVDFLGPEAHFPTNGAWHSEEELLEELLGGEL